MNIKESLLKMPAWKAFACLILLMFGFGIVFEEIVAHTVFHVFDRMIFKMEKEKIDDLNDIDDIRKSEQEDNCNKYEWILEQKANFRKQELEGTPKSDIDYRFVEEDEREINFSIAHHQFNLEQCNKTLKSETH